MGLANSVLICTRFDLSFFVVPFPVEGCDNGVRKLKRLSPKYKQSRRIRKEPNTPQAGYHKGNSEHVPSHVPVPLRKL